MERNQNEHENGTFAAWSVISEEFRIWARHVPLISYMQHKYGLSKHCRYVLCLADDLLGALWVKYANGTLEQRERLLIRPSGRQLVLRSRCLPVAATNATSGSM